MARRDDMARRIANTDHRALDNNEHTRKCQEFDRKCYRYDAAGVPGRDSARRMSEVKQVDKSESAVGGGNLAAYLDGSWLSPWRTVSGLTKI